jgi:hypothetical protein
LLLIIELRDIFTRSLVGLRSPLVFALILVIVEKLSGNNSNTEFDNKYIIINRLPVFPRPSYFHYGRILQCFQHYMDNKLLMIPIQKNDLNLLVKDD